MLEDREYMRCSDGERRRLSATTVLLVVLVVVFLIQTVMIVAFKTSVVDKTLGLSLNGMRHGYVWQLFTFQFLHAAPMPWHLLFNGIALYFFGHALEDIFGKSRFLTLYFLSGTLGGILQLLTIWLLGRPADDPTVGASAGLCGLIATYATMFPDKEMCMMVYFFPVRIKAKIFLWFTLALSVFGTLIPFDYVAHAAHLGGLLTGIAWVKLGWQHDFNQLPWESWFKKNDRTKSRSTSRPSTGPSRRSGSAEGSESAETFINSDVDAILDKISAQGIQSLTDAERKVLEAARKKMGSR
jgi:membrane associated rhomboid family serine protease